MSPRNRRLVVALCLSAGLAPACAVQDTVAIGACLRGSCDGDGGSSDAMPRPDYCARSGPSMLLGAGPGGSELCAGNLAERTFARALCTCASHTVNAGFTTDSFDSSRGSYQPGEPGGDVALNGKLWGHLDVTIGGSLTCSDPAGIDANSTLSVAGDLHNAGPLGTETAAVDVAGDAFVAGDIQVADLAVDGTLTLPDGAALEVSGTDAVASVTRAPVQVDPACACGTGEILDVAGIVAAHHLANHNADIDLDDSALSDFTAATRLELPCGRFYLQRIQGDSSLTIVAGPRTALFVGEGITIHSALTIELLDGGELDLFVAGHINTEGVVEIGSGDGPARVRIYVGGAGGIDMSAAVSFGANLYAPRVDLALAGVTEVHGALFVNRISSAGPLNIHYDRLIEAVGADCPD